MASKVDATVLVRIGFAGGFVLWLLRKVATQQIQIQHYKAREWLWRKLGALGS